ncbi:hypothetical protein [Nocardioides iriomotensis]|uniref:Sulfotransferase family protein n=1 Tax=Nocardioides iriomotensis TaxID=715784 RepID=A0A4Q5IWI5_9ACTN|nr:hypothetical protein [Nocardioides iriomotensis]RYU10323.1 hypothetical protein ETU37_18275 [Nocardioides iriomotensis]
MTAKVILHVGAPKTGTSYVQDLLFTHREELAAAGTLYPADRFDAHFLAALDLMELQWGGLEKQAVGAWDRLAEQVRGWDGTVIVSHEILATATPTQVRRAFASFGDGVEVHVVLSARDLVRQIPAEWQENVKHRRVVGYRDFLDKITDPARKGTLASWFWGVQEVPDILDRWGSSLPASQVHVVTVPPPGAPRGLLWERFASVFGLDAATYAKPSGRDNPSMGVPETALIRRINERVNNGVLANEDYRQFVRELLAHQHLSRRTGSPRLTLPPDVRAWAEDLSETWIKVLAAKGYDVVGSLDDLRPAPASRSEAEASFADPDAPDEDQVAEASLDAIVTLLQENARLQAREHALREDVHAAHRELDRVRGLWFRVKRRLVREADGNAVLGRALSFYRRVRGSSSRSA